LEKRIKPLITKFNTANKALLRKADAGFSEPAKILKNVQLAPKNQSVEQIRLLPGFGKKLSQ
jgi:hypothetical protein